MHKLWFPLLLLAVLLTACAPQAQTPTATIAPTITQPAAVGTPTLLPIALTGSAQCTMVSLVPTPNATEASLFPPARESDWVKGSAGAKVTFIEYTDFQCPFCAQLEPVLAQLSKMYPQDVRIVFRHFPLVSIHDKAMISAQAAEAAGKQGKFFEMAELLFLNQNQWAMLSPEQFPDWVKQQAQALGLDVVQFANDMVSAETVKKVQDSLNEGTQAGIPGTPFLLINGRIYQGSRDYNTLEAIVKLLKLEDQQFSECPPMTLDLTKRYIATIKTEKGDVVIELFPQQAPFTVNSFIFLARHNWFDNTIFHRVVPNFVAQAGDPSGTGYGGPGYAFSNEFLTANYRYDKPGVVGMANAGPDANGSQFFITYGPQPQLDGKYTIFGQVIQGMEVLNQFGSRDPTQPDTPGVKILTITIEEK